MTPAHQVELIFVAVVKRWLEGECSVADRVAYLEWLASYDKAPITPAVVAGVQPADDVTMEIVTEAIRLSISANDDGQAMFAVLERPDVLGLLRQCQ
jgi:hypothetical protein